MDITLAYGVSIWLRHMQPEKTVQAYLRGKIIADSERRERFVSFGLRQYPQYTENELQNLYSFMMSEEAIQRHDAPRCTGLFRHIYNLAAQALHMDGDVVRCRHDQMVDWREAVHGVGQTPFLCAFLAWEDYRTGHKRARFDWSPYAKTDNLRLRQMLGRGMAENHFHLKGSAPPFMLAWICLMNHVTRRAEEFNALKRPFFLTERDNPQQELHIQVFKAAVIRLLLSRVLLGENVDDRTDSQGESLKQKCHHLLDMRFGSVAIFAGDLQGYLDAERLIWHPNSLDYLYDTHLRKGDPVFKLIAGEHAFQYRMFAAIFSRDLRIKPYQDLFEAYLLIYVRLRSELVQMNQNVGFFNFANYEQRKELFVENYPAYQDALKQLAYNGVLQNPAIHMLEVRISPKPPNVIHAQMQRDMHLICEYERLSCGNFDSVRGECKHMQRDPNKEPPCMERLCYTVHLVKDPKLLSVADGKTSANVAASYLYCRHYEFRKANVRTAIDGLLSWRNTGAMEAGLIYAIDACNHEIGCRPEVFAPGFRLARVSTLNAQALLLQGVKMPILRVTYHVGEDYLDVVDGLRAIDEAMRFLDLRHGDRLGHAISLGIEAVEWYQFKNNRLFLQRQDLLDNAVWFLIKLKEFGISTAAIDHELRTVFRDQFNYVYRSSIPFDQFEHSISVETYYEGWMLRGDEPSVYMECSYDTQGMDCVSRIDREAEEKRQFQRRFDRLKPGEFQDNPDCNRIRQDNWQAVMLMHNYHYNPDVKRRGAEPVEFAVSPSYARAVMELQVAMRNDVAHRGIAIETNPSSNYLISTFRRYDRHPLLHFHPVVSGRDHNSAALSASINTDDQGVFDTDLENEYALMACALENARDDQGSQSYEPDQIYQWLDRIRIMGLEQSFKSNPSKMGGV